MQSSGPLSSWHTTTLPAEMQENVRTVEAESQVQSSLWLDEVKQ